MDAQAAYDAGMADLRRQAPALATGLDGLAVDMAGTFTIEIAPGAIRVNARWFAGLDAEERVAALASAAFRLVSPLMRPCGDRDFFVWNLACSAIVNANLSAMGFRLPKGVIVEPTCRTRTSDEVYERIKDIPGLARPAAREVN